MDKITFADLKKVDIRIGTVIKAQVPSWSHWVMKLDVDFGSELGKKICFAGIMKFFSPKDLEKKQFPFILNLEPKTIGPNKEESECMMLMAVPKEDEKTPPVLFKPAKKVPNGTKVE